MKQQNMAVWHKGIRFALIILLAVIMVMAFVMERSRLTRAGDEDPAAVAGETGSELVEAPAPAPEPAPAPAAEPAPAPQPDPAQQTAKASAEGGEADKSAAEPTNTAEVAEEVTEEEIEETEPVVTATPGVALAAADVEPTPEVVEYANAEEDKDFRSGPATALGAISVSSDRKATHELANLPEGSIVRVTKRVEVKDEEGEVVETWLGVSFMADEQTEGDEEAGLVKVDGYVSAWSVKPMDGAEYLRRVEITEEDIAEAKALGLSIEEPIETADGLPVIHVPYTPVPKKQAVEKSEEEISTEDKGESAARVEVSIEHEGEMELGTVVTLRAKLINMPLDQPVHLQWMNDATGEYEDVPGANGDTFAFQVDANNIDWKWVMEVKIGSDV